MDILKNYYEINIEEIKRINENINKFSNYLNSNLKFQNTILKYKEYIKKYSRVHRSQKQNNIVDDENATQSSSPRI